MKPSFPHPYRRAAPDQLAVNISPRSVLTVSTLAHIDGGPNVSTAPKSSPRREGSTRMTMHHGGRLSNVSVAGTPARRNAGIPVVVKRTDPDRRKHEFPQGPRPSSVVEVKTGSYVITYEDIPEMGAAGQLHS
jgi:hypothetical protein